MQVYVTNVLFYCVLYMYVYVTTVLFYFVYICVCD
jgi:hypothetical protein